ncbi:DUF3667 domain-containing protein [Brevundimonas sp. M20]|uniref:DUF3667 domain-containing protein n=1 Tax=Brevundimonas sp. M20 TaxID=2591463 RepID=UPI0011473B14|nr:DUF3667 domain-containing protein [Brevundimonas sp. M20]QDH74348.1 DUF3667 domain-containing protein [Brevundimonas sp. M20]
MDIEAAGGAVTGGLIAGAIEKPTGKAGDDHTGTCADCGSETSGNFCSTCGQPTHVHRTLLHLGEEVLHGVMHFDARIWRTLPLLAFNPGKLTREWIHGKRTRYVSPLAIFLFTVFITFFALSFVHMPEATFRPADPSVAAEGAEGFAEGRREIAAARAEATTTADKVALDVADNVMASVADQAATQGQPRPDGLTPGSWQANVHDIAARIYADPKAGKNVRKTAKKLMNPDLAVYKIQQTFYKFAFLLVPLSIPFMAVLFLWRRKTTLYDHGVFVLYSLTFAVMAGLIAIGLGFIHPALGALAWFAFIFGMPVHQFAQLKGGYELGWFSTIWRFVLLQNFCFIVIGLFITAIVYLAVGV